ncbi:hypothetical protein [Gilliamella sp. B3172]|nr:hypothetical protein [Gilliamella sp. B3172]
MTLLLGLAMLTDLISTLPHFLALIFGQMFEHISAMLWFFVN